MSASTARTCPRCATGAGRRPSRAPMAKLDERTVLALNCGSSSLKFGALPRRTVRATEPLIEGEARSDRRRTQAAFSATAEDGALVSVEGRDRRATPRPSRRVFALLAEQRAPAPTAVGHRIVHGGPSVRRHCLIDPQVLRGAGGRAGLRAAARAGRAGGGAAGPGAIRAQPARRLPRHRLPLGPARRGAAPADRRRAAGADGVERYGFHGLSCESIVRQLGRRCPTDW